VTTDVVESTHVPFFEYPFTIGADAIAQLISDVGDPVLFKKTVSNTSRGWARRGVDYVNTTTLIENTNFPDEIKQKFSTLDQSKWVNLFDPFQTFQVDKGPEGHHPGIKSHAMMAEKISHYLHNENIL
jgi:hypothetical protein